MHTRTRIHVHTDVRECVRERHTKQKRSFIKQAGRQQAFMKPEHKQKTILGFVNIRFIIILYRRIQRKCTCCE